jgi:predicted nucleic acid-binding protein
MIAYLRGEVGADAVSAILLDSTNQSLAHALNLCEVYYDFYRVSGAEVATEAVRDLMAVGVQLRDDMSPEFWQTAGALKATLKRISLADCFAIALAQAAGGRILTSDHSEFDLISSDGICAVEFIR